MNTYGYVGGNPLGEIDAYGLVEIQFGPQYSGSNSPYNQAVTVVSNYGSVLGSRPVLGTFSGSSTPNPYKPSNPNITGTNAYPQVASGSYPAATGFHMGSPAIVVNNDAPVPTTAPNPNFPQQGSTATYIRIHPGSTSSWKGSAGCFTIDPSQWQRFMTVIPNESHTVIVP